MCHRTGMLRGRRVFRAAVGSGSSLVLFSLSTRGRRGRKRVLGALRPDTSHPRSPTTRAHRDPLSCTWGTRARLPLPPYPSLCGSPNCGSRARDRSSCRPMAASCRQWHVAPGWGRPVCWSPPDIVVVRHSAPGAVTRAAWAWACAVVHSGSATAAWRHIGQSESRPAVCLTHSRPVRVENPHTGEDLDRSMHYWAQYCSAFHASTSFKTISCLDLLDYLAFITFLVFGPVAFQLGYKSQGSSPLLTSLPLCWAERVSRKAKTFPHTDISRHTPGVGSDTKSPAGCITNTPLVVSPSIKPSEVRHLAARS